MKAEQIRAGRDELMQRINAGRNAEQKSADAFALIGWSLSELAAQLAEHNALTADLNAAAKRVMERAGL